MGGARTHTSSSSFRWSRLLLLAFATAVVRSARPARAFSIVGSGGGDHQVGPSARRRSKTTTTTRQQGLLQHRRKPLILSLAVSTHKDGDNTDASDEQLLSRRTFWTKSTASTGKAAAALLLATTSTTIGSSSSGASAEELTVVKTPSGLKYIDLQPGTGPSPAYGNLCSISYKAYIKLPDSSKNNSSNNKPQLYDQSDAYLIKHGNGRTIAGLDEGLHTMRAGGVRRLLIPPKLGFVDSGLGPLPDTPWNRSKLNRLLDRMVAAAGGTVIYEVRLRSVVPDEADQGYYSDASLTPEEFAALRENLRLKGNEELRRRAAENSLGVTGQERLL